jgi:hypothetical protein
MDMWTIGFADRLRFPRLPSQLGKRGNARLRPHTGATADKGFDIDGVKSRIVKPAIAVAASGAIEISWATP